MFYILPSNYYYYEEVEFHEASNNLNDSILQVMMHGREDAECLETATNLKHVNE